MAAGSRSTSGELDVLLVDESTFNAKVIGRVLEDEPALRLHHCAEPRQAASRAAALAPAVLLCTVTSSDADTDFEMLRLLREAGPTRALPVIALAGEADDELRFGALRAGADEMITGANGWLELSSRIRACCGEHQAQLRSAGPVGADERADEGQIKVLMVDDSPLICKGIAQQLSEARNVVFTYCVDPGMALDVARRFAPTVILLDLEMPKITGFDLLRDLRADPELGDRPVVILSGNSDPAVKARAFAMGANDYVQKQMNRVEIIGRIRHQARAYISSRMLRAAMAQLEVQRNFIRKTFGRYLSDEIVDSLLETPEGLELGGEKREITVMMADLRGFTSIGERLPPEAVVAVINNFLGVMTEILLRYQGTIDEFIGDAILAIFGAPEHRDDDARRAVTAAVEMQLAMAEVNRRNREAGYPEVSMGIGLNTGEAVVGNIGSEKRSKYGVVGRNVNLTSRIESYTVGGQIYVSEATRAACGDLLRIDDERRVMPKGVARPITIYEVGGIGGDLDLFLPEKREAELVALAEPRPVRFCVLEGKHSGQELHEGAIVSIAEDAAGIQAELDIDDLSNLKIALTDAGGAEVTADLYCKVVAVVSEAPRVFRVQCTSVPPEAEPVLAELRGAAS